MGQSASRPVQKGERTAGPARSPGLFAQSTRSPFKGNTPRRVLDCATDRKKSPKRSELVGATIHGRSGSSVRLLSDWQARSHEVPTPTAEAATDLFGSWSAQGIHVARTWHGACL